MTRLAVSLIGSFRQHYAHVVRAAGIFSAAGMEIRSPAMSRIVNPGDNYVRFESILQRRLITASRPRRS
jgi:hypothetical protein